MKTWLKRAPLAALLLLLTVLLLTGCGDDRPVSDLSQPRPVAQAAPAGGQDAPVADASPTAIDTPADPLLNGTGDTPRDPLLSSDPLQGPTMPTKHSHWLRGHVRNARLTVLLNSAPLGTYSGPLDKDITMRLRPGLNLITFTYEPTNAAAAAQMEVLESEHNPPIAPLVTFQALPSFQESKPEPVTQTFRFIAN